MCDQPDRIGTERLQDLWVRRRDRAQRLADEVDVMNCLPLGKIE